MDLSFQHALGARLTRSSPARSCPRVLPEPLHHRPQAYGIGCVWWGWWWAKGSTVQLPCVAATARASDAFHVPAHGPGVMPHVNPYACSAGPATLVRVCVCAAHTHLANACLSLACPTRCMSPPPPPEPTMSPTVRTRVLLHTGCPVSSALLAWYRNVTVVLGTGSVPRASHVAAFSKPQGSPPSPTKPQHQPTSHSCRAHDP